MYSGPSIHCTGLEFVACNDLYLKHLFYARPQMIARLHESVL